MARRSLMTDEPDNTPDWIKKHERQRAEEKRQADEISPRCRARQGTQGRIDYDRCRRTCKAGPRS